MESELEVEPEALPQATAILDEFKKVTDVLENTIKKRNAGSFTARDETETVEVTVNSDGTITSLWIEDGLLKFGAQTVEDRINDALTSAKAKSAAINEEMSLEIVATMMEAVDKMSKTATED